MSVTVTLRDAAHDITHELITDRRYLHQHPELAWREEGTAALRYLNQ